MRPPAASESTPQRSGASGPSAAGHELSADAVHVLVVDDNEDASTMLAMLLGACGFRTSTARDGASALRAAAAFTPDIAILDIGLPMMDGYELARQFAADAQLRGTRLVALTGYGQDLDRARSSAAGFAAHLVKPVDLGELRATLERLGHRPR
jgi:CheY-like chemotaxis protein